MKRKIDLQIARAIGHVLNTSTIGYRVQRIKRNNAIWYEFWHDAYRDFFIEETLDGKRCVVFKKDSAQEIAQDVAMLLHCKLIDPNDIEIPI